MHPPVDGRVTQKGLIVAKGNRRGTVTAKCGTSFTYTIGDDASYRLARQRAQEADRVTRHGFWRESREQRWGRGR